LKEVYSFSISKIILYYVVIETCLKETLIILSICEKIMKINVNFTMQPAYIVPYIFPLKKLIMMRNVQTFT